MKVQISDLCKKYDGKPVLNIDSLTFEQGRIHVIIGPNGSGKSTLVNIISGLDKADHGTVTYGSRKESFEEVKGSITLVMQHPYLFNTTVFSNIAYGLRCRGIDRKQTELLVKEAAERVNLSAFLARKASTLSGGEMQRVALARALVLKPELLLLDEATVNLDPESIGIIERVIRDFQTATGATVVFITHNIFQAKRIAERVYLIMDGRIIEEGSREKTFGNPESRITREFLGGELIF